MRPPLSLLVDATAKPIFFPTVPDRKPRTECGCQPVAFMISAKVAPFSRRSRLMTSAVLLPPRAVARASPVGGAFFDFPCPGPTLAVSAFLGDVGVFLAAVAFFPDLPLAGATWARGFAVRALLLAFGSGLEFEVCVVSFVDVVMICPFAVVTAVTI